MNFYHYNETPADHFREGAQRRLAVNENLMMVIFDFDDGPQTEPEKPHSHPHEQTSYIAEGEINFFMGDECQHLRPGDMVSIPSNMPHAIQLLTEHVRLVDSFTPLRQDFLK